MSMGYFGRLMIEDVVRVVGVATSQTYGCGVYGAGNYNSSCTTTPDTVTSTGGSGGGTNQVAGTPADQNITTTTQNTTGGGTSTTNDQTTSTGQAANVSGAVGAGDVLTWVGMAVVAGAVVVAAVWALVARLRRRREGV